MVLDKEIGIRVYVLWDVYLYRITHVVYSLSAETVNRATGLKCHHGDVLPRSWHASRWNLRCYCSLDAFDSIFSSSSHAHSRRLASVLLVLLARWSGMTCRCLWGEATDYSTTSDIRWNCFFLQSYSVMIATRATVTVFLLIVHLKFLFIALVLLPCRLGWRSTTSAGTLWVWPSVSRWTHPLWASKRLGRNYWSTASGRSRIALAGASTTGKHSSITRRCVNANCR